LNTIEGGASDRELGRYLTNVRSLVGSVNNSKYIWPSGAIASNGLIVAEPGTLMIMGVSADIGYGITDANNISLNADHNPSIELFSAEIQVKMLWRKIEHSKMWNPATGLFETVVKSSGSPRYPFAVLDSIIPQPSFERMRFTSAALF